MKYSLCADIMYLTIGEHGPIWASTEQILECMDLAERFDMQGIEFWSWEDRDLDAICRKKDALGLEISAICAKGGGLLGTASALDEMVQGLRESIPAAQKLGCKNLIYNAGQYPRQAPREEVHNAMLEGFRRLTPLAEQAGLTLLLEPVSGGYFCDSAEPFSIVEQAGSDAVRVLYDIYHYQLMEGNIANTIRKYLPLIGEIHGAGAPERCELTRGENDYRFLLQYLQELGYDGWFCLEFHTFERREEKIEASCSVLI